ncbi:hypothetical protein [Clostridium botulinum]|uniref:Uncharacterized protein n=4 Tax=Clostridium botulinum TaxID=1491 RepID=A5I441_CLOBH|nr:hypothetical protein [Clostridium botulinum]EKN43404.1 hypothetical protein CFSAN001627_00735 [Clostridium botulinum CFSAN001627]EPS47629.1 hypothetical protein CFSAN002369_21203 [Clostridium botulinum CFSAN002369]EPS51269.1 hypothetical protein CFSAN002367_07875 [Clostridium botulinum CFSAN002367]ABS32348.1 hypothetical protein CLB_2215 [Clostridium botulinum A str. ATCC 19397]ABS37868.1 hypothetical protein CLC_2198 [Clostridium botulinum A str. Hall]
MGVENPTCHVRILNDETKESVYHWRKEINIVEIEAIKISKKVYCNNQYYDIKTLVFNYDNLTLEIII